MRKEYEFLASNSKLLSEHKGEWIAVVGEQVVAYGEDFDDVYDSAQKIAKEPVLLKIPKEEVVVYGHRVPVY